MMCEQIGEIDNDKLKLRINPHLFNIYPDAINEENNLYRCKSEHFLTGKRFDVMAKYIYAWHKENNVALEYAINIYKRHLQAWGDLKEQDGSGKNDFNKYLKSFNETLDSVKCDFKPAVSLIPVGNSMTIIDGAHRSAAALLYQKEADCVKLCQEENIYDYLFFREKGLSEDVTDRMALQYCELQKNIYMIFLFPIARDKDILVESILNEYGNVIYDKELELNTKGAHILMRQLYKDEHWLGDASNDFAGAMTHVKNKFDLKNSLKVFLYEAEDLFKVLEAKKIIRKQFPHGKNSIHISDTQEETIRLAQQVLNKNSISFFNNASGFYHPKFNELFELFKTALETKNIDKDKLCIDSSSVMALYGIRDANDLDYLDFENHERIMLGEDINCHNDELIYYKKTLGELIFNPENYFYYDGVKFLTLENVKKMKQNRNELKDQKDIQLIEQLYVGSGTLASKTFGGSKMPIYSKSHIKKVLKNNLPLAVLRPMKAIWHLTKDIKKVFLSTIDILKPTYRIIDYLNYKVYYSRGTTLIDRIRNGQMYEPELTKKLYLELSKLDTSFVLDIGCNIGLISLNILNSFPKVKIHAFEPGEHQAMLFEETIKINGLENRVSLEKLALSNNTGYAEFAVHDTSDASGDGFFDTKRAGKTKVVKVKTIKLDEWWEQNGHPGAKLVKIDTEGAELWVFEGGKQFIKHCQPTIIFEMHPDNLKPFPYEALDILEFFKSIDYVIYTFGGQLIDEDNYRQYLDTVHDYIAKPRV